MSSFLCCGLRSRSKLYQDEELPFLHGVLYITIHWARNLPNTDRQSKLKDGLRIKDVSDPYVTVFLDDYRLCKSSTVNNDLNPHWEEKFRVDAVYPAKFLIVRVKDEDIIGSDDDLGRLRFDVAFLLQETPISGCHNLLDANGKLNGGSLKFEILFKSAESLKQSIEVPECYFPVRNNCKVTLYQDAHTPSTPLFEKIKLGSGETYSPPCAWRDIFQALIDAKHFIYFTGWSVYTEVFLLRDDTEQITLGELLKKKASEGVRVLGLVWDEKLSTDLTPGLMGTHDEETGRYFANTGVTVVLVPRGRDSGGITSQLISTCYSHHQKAIVVDAATEVVEDAKTNDSTNDDCHSDSDKKPDDEKRRIVAFVGGLDLTDGRWDTPEHSLFSSLKTTHKGDFYNSSASVSPHNGPRQPWHDIHSRVEGRAAYDVMQNFFERWHKQAAKHEDLLVQVSEDDFDLDAVGCVMKDEDKWSVQLLRSINMDSAVFDPAQWLGLSGKRHRARDDSIQRSYMHHIRRAREFVYIENQFFLGSSRMWKSPETNANHLIPVELVNKICDKIKVGERFASYIVIPMHPEGSPSSAAVQEMLHWQKNTMEMMYTRIAECLKKNNPKAELTDYLNFYCLGNREDVVPGDPPSPKSKTSEATLRKKRRFMVYVHSKMMIIDDEYIIVGSANINQRSMGANRDTEIAVGAYQTEQTMQKVDGLPKGHVHGFRMALWAEHLACVEEVFQNPSAVSCVQLVNTLANENWRLYAADEVCDMQGHLLKYPVKVGADGSVRYLPNCKHFPDTSAPILGKRSRFLPNKLTT